MTPHELADATFGPCRRDDCPGSSVPPGTVLAMTTDATETGLTDRDVEMLEFERHWWKYAGAKEQSIRARFEVSSTRYYQQLNVLIDNPAALAADPLLVRRLRRLRAARQRQRSARRLGFD